MSKIILVSAAIGSLLIAANSAVAQSSKTINRDSITTNAYRSFVSPPEGRTTNPDNLRGVTNRPDDGGGGR